RRSGRGKSVRAVRPGDVGDSVVLEAAIALGALGAGGRQPNRGASSSESANCRQSKRAIRAAHLDTPVCVRHELAAVIVSPAFRPLLPPTVLPAEHSSIARQPLEQPTISVTRRRYSFLSMANTTPQYPSPFHGRTHTLSPTDLPDVRAPLPRSRAAISA